MGEKDLALIGIGYWGKNLARNFYSLGVLHTICDSNKELLHTYDEVYPDVKKRTSVDEVMRDPEIKKVAIAAPAALHYNLARYALEAGKDVFVEKPLCLDLREAEELVDMAEQSSRILMVGHLLHYHPCVEKMRAMVGAGDLGKLYYIVSNRLNLGKIRQEENALWSFAPHDISVIISLVGNELPREVRCVGGAYLNHGVADTTLTFLRFSGDIRAHIYVSWLNPFKEQKLTVIGSNGMLVFDDTLSWEKKLVLYKEYLTWKDGCLPVPVKNAGEYVTVAQEEPLRRECEHFLVCCETRRKPLTDGHEGLRVLRVLKMAQESIENEGDKVTGVSIVESPERNFFVHPTAVVDDGAAIGNGTRIWHFSHIMKGAAIGNDCNIGQNVFIGDGVRIGNNVKIQNNVSVYKGVEIEDDVFLGPSCVLTNIRNPRSQVVRRHLYEKTIIQKGATVGANATIVCGVTIGRYAFIAAGAVVTKDVPDYALMVGNPARRIGWMSRHGHKLIPKKDGIMVCPESGLRYKEMAPEVLRCIDLKEDEPLPPELSKGKASYQEIKSGKESKNG